MQRFLLTEQDTVKKKKKSKKKQKKPHTRQCVQLSQLIRKRRISYIMVLGVRVSEKDKFQVSWYMTWCVMQLCSSETAKFLSKYTMQVTCNAVTPQ